MMANNSSGARSVIYGKTGDHVATQRVVLADGSAATLQPLAGAALDAARQGDGLLARAYRDVPALAVEQADEIARRFPKVMRRVGGYALDAFTDPAAPVDLTRLMVGSEGTLGFVTEATVRLVPLPAEKTLVTLEFDDLLDALGATPLVLAHGSSGTPSATRRSIAPSDRSSTGRPRRCCASSSTATTSTRSCRACRRSSATSPAPVCAAGSGTWSTRWRRPASGTSASRRWVSRWA
jgi:FAD/FMN-containing dehydrogenase